MSTKNTLCVRILCHPKTHDLLASLRFDHFQCTDFSTPRYLTKVGLMYVVYISHKVFCKLESHI